MAILFTVTIFWGAALLFLVQPMFARLVLPLLGGSPAVWNTAMVFYQAALLAGYGYAHLTTRWCSVRRQIWLHLAVLGSPLLVLPIMIPHGWTPPTQHTPIPWLLALLAVAVGLPFFVIATTAPLLQRWWAASDHPQAGDPYFLYAASNCGSLLALISYPVLIEPRWRLVEQTRWWSAGYVVLLALVASCGLWTQRANRGSQPTPAVVEPEVAPLTMRRRGRWLLLAFVPCSLMLSVTTYITNAIAPIPLLWVIPLGIYLLSFVLVFARRRLVPHRWLVWTVPLVVLALPWTVVGMLLGQPMEPLDLYVTLHLAGLFVVAMVCHGELANDRPPAAQLTEFYLWIAGGGVLGGIFNALLAPWLFPTVFEYPLTLIVACALVPRRAGGESKRRAWLGDVAWPVLLGVFTYGLMMFLNFHLFEPRWLRVVLAFVLPPLLCLAFFRRPIRFAFGVALLVLATMLPLAGRFRPIRRARSFFGVHQVFATGEYHVLKHGSTAHGLQSYRPGRRREPLAYFARTGPLGELLRTVPAALKNHVAVIGLGAGTVACYGEMGQHWNFYEIDPVVEHIAREPRCFTYLLECPADVHVVLGDARLSLQREPDGQFGVLIIDAYNSDTPPLHLLTREALALYLRKLAPDGVLAFHISTSHLDLKSVLANLAQDAGLTALHLIDFPSAANRARGQSVSRWMVMTRQPATLQALADSGYWRPPRPQPAVGVWTDDFTSIWRVWNWN